MPTPVIIIATIISMSLLFASYSQRFIGLYRKNYSLNPLTPLSWLISGAVAVTFSAVSQNFVLAFIGMLASILQAVLFVWNVRNFRKSKDRNWEIRPEDYVCFGLSIVAAITFYFTGNATLGASISFAGSVLGELPQMRKNFVEPHTDQIKIYLIVVARYTVLVGTLQSINMVGLINSIFWAVFCSMEAAWLFYCQRRILLDTRILATETIKISDE